MRGRDQRLVHRQGRRAVAANAAVIAERVQDGLAEHDAEVLGRVVAVDLDVALAP